MNRIPALLLLMLGMSPSSVTARQPNIILLLVDDMGYGDIAAHGNPILSTPNFDRLHDESLRFDDFVVSPTCAPTRAALMSGMHEFKVGVTHTIHPRHQMALGATILPQLLKTPDIEPACLGNGTLAPPLVCDPNWLDLSARVELHFVDADYPVFAAPPPTPPSRPTGAQGHRGQKSNFLAIKPTTLRILREGKQKAAAHELDSRLQADGKGLAARQGQDHRSRAPARVADRRLHPQRILQERGHSPSRSSSSAGSRRSNDSRLSSGTP